MDLQTGLLGPHSPNNKVTQSLNSDLARFNHQSEECPAFDNFLHDISGGDPLLEQRIWEIIGYCLTPDTNAKVFFLFQGVPNSGKTLLCNLLSDFFPEEKFSALSVHSLKDQFSTGNLEEKSLCISPDLPACELDPKSASIIKQLTGNDKVSVAVKYKNNAQFRFEGKLILASNYPLLTAKPDDAFGNKYLWIGFKNTLFIIAVSIVFNVLLGTITAYIIERFEFKFKKVIVGLFFVGMLVPTFVTEIARFKIINGIGLYNTLGAPIVIYVASDLMQLYIYRQFLSKLPVSLDESALLDGCSYFQLFIRIIFPLLAPATATVAIIKAITIINDMYIPYLYMPKNKLRTLTTFLMNYANVQQGSWQTLAAGIIIIMLPTILIYLFFQRYILAGVAAGAVKE